MTTVKEIEGVESKCDEAADGMEVDELQSEGEKVRTRNPSAYSPTVVLRCLFSRFVAAYRHYGHAWSQETRYLGKGRWWWCGPSF